MSEFFLVFMAVLTMIFFICLVIVIKSHDCPKVSGKARVEGFKPDTMYVIEFTEKDGITVKEEE